jgi:replication factor A3
MATPRVNSRLVGNFKGQSVRLVGKRVATNTTSVTLEASDHQQVIVQTANPAQYQMHAYAEVTGKVNDDGSLTELNMCNFGDDFDLDSYDKVVELSHGKFSSLFM